MLAQDKSSSKELSSSKCSINASPVAFVGTIFLYKQAEFSPYPDFSFILQSVHHGGTCPSCEMTASDNRNKEKGS